MKEIYTEEVEKEIKRRKKMPKELKDKMNKDVFRNLMFAIAIILYLVLLNLGFWKLDKEIFIKDTAIYSIASLAVTIILFEKAFKSENGRYAISGIEVLTASIFTYFIPYTYFHISDVARKLWMLLPLAYAIYYTGKGIVICIKTKNMRQSDVKEIIKEEKTKQEESVYIDKDREAEVRAKILEEIKEESKNKVVHESDTSVQNKRIAKTKTSKTTSTTTKAKKKEKVSEETKPKTAARIKKASTETKDKELKTKEKETSKPVRKRTVKKQPDKEEKQEPKSRARKKKVEE